MPSFRPHATYSDDADALYVYLSEGSVVRTRVLDDRRIVDLGDGGRVVGIEFIDASAGVDLTDLPFKHEVAALIRDFPFPVFA